MAEDESGEWLRREDVVRFLNSTSLTPFRERLPETRESVTRKFKIARPGHRNGELRMYVTVGLYPDGRPGELFIHSDRTGSFASGALDAVAMCMSIALQHGVPFEPLVEKLRGMRFEPQGMTGDPKYAIVTSPLDYVARWLLDRFGKTSEENKT
jgi:ribonucleoside-diphosphate reductase alpha chain